MAIVASPVTGFVIDLFGFGGIFVFASLCMFAAFFVMGNVSKGEAVEAPQKS